MHSSTKLEIVRESLPDYHTSARNWRAGMAFTRGHIIMKRKPLPQAKGAPKRPRREPQARHEDRGRRSPGPTTGSTEEPRPRAALPERDQAPMARSSARTPRAEVPLRQVLHHRPQQPCVSDRLEHAMMTGQ